jgi:predicted fused transcriptional regulator/phosphomethylpyrimidine kinase
MIIVFGETPAEVVRKIKLIQWTVNIV